MDGGLRQTSQFEDISVVKFCFTTAQLADEQNLKARENQLNKPKAKKE